jgi:alginate O-acetyltransferase complex protein AlgJ
MIKLSERLFLALIIVTFLLPAVLTLWTRFGNPPHQVDWIANRTLYGVTVEKKVPPVGLGSWKSGELQKGLNTLASENFAGRELLIRAYNEVLFSVFHKSYMYRESIIAGKHGDLFERGYLIAHGGFTKLIPSGDAEALAVMMKHLSERLKALGSCFVFVITPNKATLYPEDIPVRFLNKIGNGEREATDYEILVPLLKRYNIPYVDGREITLEHKDTLPVRAFPKTGTHWSRAAAFFTTAALLKTFQRESGREMPLLAQSIQSIDHQPDYSDADLLNLLNVVQKTHQRYLHPGFQIPDDWPRRKGILTIVGGSFVGAIASALEAAQVFERINYYNYFKVFRERFPEEVVSPVDENKIPWEEDFWKAAAVILEANETAINGRHVHAFLMAALEALQQQTPQERDVPESPRPLSWGFGAGENGAVPLKKGFGSPERQLTWITDQYAQIELPSPGANADVQLVIEAMPVLGDGVSGRTVYVEANGTPVGSIWLWQPDIQFYSLTINAAANSGPVLNLKLSFSHEPSSSSGDGQLREIGLARLALVPMGHPVNQVFGRIKKSVGKA